MLGWRAAAATVGAATLVAAAYRVYVRARSQTRRRIAVASTSKQKLEAAACALDGSVAGSKTESLVADQPIGLDETMRGARNRLTALLDADAADGADLAVAIENGLMRMSTKLGDEEEEVWVDLAVVILRDLHTGRESIATSPGVQFPTAAVGEWAEGAPRGFKRAHNVECVETWPVGPTNCGPRPQPLFASSDTNQLCIRFTSYSRWRRHGRRSARGAALV